MKYSELDDFPHEIKEYIMLIAEDKASAWIHQSIPVLKNRSIVETANSDGLEAVVRYLRRAGSKLDIRQSLKLFENK